MLSVTLQTKGANPSRSLSSRIRIRLCFVTKYCNCCLGNPITLAVTTQERTGIGGKVWTLKHLCNTSSRTWHADDNTDICREIVKDSEQRILVAGIRVPKHWKTQRQLNIFWYQNILDALQIFLRG